MGAVAVDIAIDSRLPSVVVVRRAPSEPHVILDGRAISRLLVILALGIVLLGYFREWYLVRFGYGTVLKDLRHIALDSEHTIAAWFSSLVLLLAAALLGYIANLRWRARDDDWRRWAVLALLFAAMALDEAVSFHELLIKPLRAVFGLDGIFYFAWVIPAAVVVTVLAAFYLPFLLRLPSRHAFRFAACGVIYVGGALGMEMVSGSFASRFGMQSMSYIGAACIEETLEIVGITLFCCALFCYLRESFSGISLRID